MPVTGLRGRQIKDDDVTRADLNVTTSGSAVITRIIAGTNISITSTGVDTGTGDVTINATAGTGSVTSVGLTAPNIFGVTGSPVTTSGTIAISLVNQLANRIWAGPTSGAEAAPTFRALVQADIPDLTLEKIPDAWVKRSVRVATTANITLSGTQTIDGIGVVAGDRVLVKNQSTGSQNGIYVVAAGSWTRALDCNTSAELAAAFVGVDSGTTNGGTNWQTNFRATDTIGTTTMTWTRVIDASQGQALTRTNDTNVTLTLGGSSSTALLNAASLTLGWTGTLAVSRGGTGAGTLTGVVIGNGTNAFTGVTGTANQLLRRNAGNTAYEFFTHNFLSTTGGTLTGTLIFGNATSPNTHTIQFGDNTGWVLRFMTNVSGTPTQRFSFADNGTFSAVGQIISTKANTTADGTGQIFLNGTGGNRIEWSTAGIGAPAYTTRSVGTKLVLYPSVNASQVDYGFGIESDTLWASVAVTGGSFKWYGGTQLNMHLSGQNLVIGTGAGVGAGRLTVNAAAGGTSLYLTDALNSTLYVTHTAGGRTTFFNGTATAWLQEVGGNVTIGSSTSAPSKLFLFNTNDSIPDYQITHQSAATSMPTTSPIVITNLYNSGANGHNLFITSTSETGSWEYNITKTWGGILTFGMSVNGTSVKRDLYIYSSGQIRLANYTTTTSFTGTAVGVLGFTSDGSIITIATPGGGSGITGTGTQNYITKFSNAGATSIGNSLLFDNGTNIGINTATPTNTANYTSVQVNGTSGGIVRFSYGGTNAGHIYGSSAETAVNAPSQFNVYVNNVQIANAQSGQFNTYETFYARKLGSQIQIAGGVGTASGIFQAGNNLLFMADWATGLNGIVTDVGNGVFYTRASSANGAYIAFQRSGTTIYGYVGNSAQLGAAGYNSNTELALRSEGGINFLTTSGNPLARMQSTGQLRLPSYTTTSSHTGTAVGVLAFDSSGNIITIATPGGGGSSQWITSGVNIYYTTGGVSIGTATTSDILHIGRASGNDTFIRFDQLTRTTWRIGQSATTDEFRFINASAGSTRALIKASGQWQWLPYTAIDSFTFSNLQGNLGFDNSGNIVTTPTAFFHITFLAAGNLILNNMSSNLQFFNNQTAYITRADLNRYKRVRLHVLKGGTAGATNSKIILRYRRVSDGFSTTTTAYSNFDSECSVTINVTNQFRTSSWITLPVNAQADVYIALMQQGGDGSTDPIIGGVYAEFDYRI